MKKLSDLYEISRDLEKIPEKVKSISDEEILTTLMVFNRPIVLGNARKGVEEEMIKLLEEIHDLGVGRIF